MNDAVERPAPRQMRLGRLVVLLVPVLFAIFLSMSIASGLWSATSQQEATPAPQHLAGYHLDQAMTGPDAMAAVNELHGTDIELTDAWVAQYQGNAMIWAGRAASEEEAQELLDKMVEGIGEGGSPFQGLRQVDINGVQAYTVTDSRQQHYFYRLHDQVVWIAAPRGDEEDFVLAVLDKVR